MEGKRSKFGVNLTHLLKSGTDHPTSSIGVYAGDVDCYTVFKPILSYVVKKYHKFDPEKEKTRGEGVKVELSKED